MKRAELQRFSNERKKDFFFCLFYTEPKQILSSNIGLKQMITIFDSDVLLWVIMPEGFIFFRLTHQWEQDFFENFLR